ARVGWPADLLGLPHERWWPRVSVVLEGEAKRMTDPTDPGGDGERSDLTIVRATSDGDSAIVAHTGSLPDPAQAVVVSADRELGARVRALGASVVAPSSLLSALDRLG
ncbi:MAG: NTP pyrophosphohydrolase, partial [Humibacter sp.]